MRDKFVYKVLVNAVALYVAAEYLVRGFTLESVPTAVIAGLILGIVNAFIRPVIIILSLPFNLLTLGLLTFVINGFMLKIVEIFVPGMSLAGFGTAVWAAILISLMSMIINAVVER